MVSGLVPTLGHDASEMGALSAPVTPVSVKGGPMQLVSQVDLSTVISVENTKNKTFRGIVWVSQFSSLCQQTAGKLLMDISLHFRL